MQPTSLLPRTARRGESAQTTSHWYQSPKVWIITILALEAIATLIIGVEGYYSAINGPTLSAVSICFGVSILLALVLHNARSKQESQRPSRRDSMIEEGFVVVKSQSSSGSLGSSQVVTVSGENWLGDEITQRMEQLVPKIDELLGKQNLKVTFKPEKNTGSDVKSPDGFVSMLLVMNLSWTESGRKEEKEIRIPYVDSGDKRIVALSGVLVLKKIHEIILAPKEVQQSLTKE